jgi:hypothetical protein
MAITVPPAMIVRNTLVRDMFPPNCRKDPRGNRESLSDNAEI